MDGRSPLYRQALRQAPPSAAKRNEGPFPRGRFSSVPDVALEPGNSFDQEAEDFFGNGDDFSFYGQRTAAPSRRGRRDPQARLESDGVPQPVQKLAVTDDPDFRPRQRIVDELLDGLLPFAPGRY